MDENENKFEVISNKSSKKNLKNSNINSFGKNILLPFASGIVGCSIIY